MVLPILYLKMAHLGVVFLIFREFITSTLHPGSTGSFGPSPDSRISTPRIFFGEFIKIISLILLITVFYFPFSQNHTISSVGLSQCKRLDHIQQRIFCFLSQCVTLLSQIKVNWKSDHTFAITAENLSKKKKTSKHTNSFTRGKHTIVNSVKSHSHKREIWCHTIELTLEKSHSPAKYVKRLLHGDVTMLWISHLKIQK